MVNNFGPLSPSELLLHYGFVEVNGMDNPNTHTDIALSDLLDTAASHGQGDGAPQSDEEPPWADVARARFRFLVKHDFVRPNGCCRCVRASTS